MASKPRKWEAAFLAALEETGTISQAAKAANVGRQTVYDYKSADPEFAYRLEIALAGAADSLEAEARRRAVEGDQVPVYAQGKVVGHKTKKSDTLLMFLIKTLRECCERMERERLVQEKKDQYEEDRDSFLRGELSLKELTTPRAARRANGSSGRRVNASKASRQGRGVSANGRKQGAGSRSPGAD